MSTEYSVEEMRARLGFVVSDREPRILTWESGGGHPASIAECALWDALAERVQIGRQVAAGVDEMMAEPVAQNKVVYQVRHRSVQEGWSEWTEATKGHFDAVNAAIARGACSQTRTIQTEQSRAVPVDDAVVASFIERAASVICGKSFPSGPALAKAREIADLALTMLSAPPIDAPDSKP